MTPRLIGMTGKVRGTNVEINERLTLGSAPESTLAIRSRAVSKIHARILKVEGQYYVEDAGSRNGTFLNGQRVKRFPIRHLDVLSLAPDVDLIFMEAGTPAVAIAAPASLRGKIEWVDGPLTGKTQDFAEGRRLILGRSNELPLEAISRRHAVLAIGSQGATVEDLGSANGTWVNGKRISHVTPLADGDEVSLGNVLQCRVSLFSESAEDAAELEDTNSPTVVVEPSMRGKQQYREPVLDVIAEGTITAPRPAPPPPQAAPVAPPPPADPELPVATPDPTVVVPRAPVSLPAALAGSAAHPPGRAAADQTGKAPPAPAVVPPLKTPGARTPDTVKPPREAAGGLPSALASRARAAREAQDVTMAAPPSQPPPATEAPAPVAPVVTEAPEGETTPIKAARFEGAQTLTLPRGSFIVGRQKDSPVYIDLRDVGRKHATLTIGETKVTVEDMGSANGTFVDDVRVTNEVVVRDGGRVRFATVEFTVTYLRD